MKTIIMPLAEGFEEIEAITITDVLRRADLDVRTCYLKDPLVGGAHRIKVQADVSIDAVDAASCAMVCLPGGMPGSTNLLEDHRVIDLVQKVNKAGGYVAAICAAHVTCYPGFDGKLIGAKVSDERVVVDGKIITGNGPGSSIPFALKLVELLRGKELAQELAQGLLYRF